MPSPQRKAQSQDFTQSNQSTLFDRLVREAKARLSQPSDRKLTPVTRKRWHPAQGPFPTD